MLTPFLYKQNTGVSNNTGSTLCFLLPPVGYRFPRGAGEPPYLDFLSRTEEILADKMHLPVLYMELLAQVHS